jgi:hypothetical protein
MGCNGVLTGRAAACPCRVCIRARPPRPAKAAPLPLPPDTTACSYGRTHEQAANACGAQPSPLGGGRSPTGRVRFGNATMPVARRPLAVVTEVAKAVAHWQHTTRKHE